MKHYVVHFKYDDPYPKTSNDYRVSASNPGIAYKRAFGMFRKDHPRKQFKALTAFCIYVGKVDADRNELIPDDPYLPAEKLS